MKTLLLAGIAALSVLTASAAHATVDGCALVLKPPAKVTRDKDYNDRSMWLSIVNFLARRRYTKG